MDSSDTTMHDSQRVQTQFRELENRKENLQSFLLRTAADQPEFQQTVAELWRVVLTTSPEQLSETEKLAQTTQTTFDRVFNRFDRLETLLATSEATSNSNATSPSIANAPAGPFNTAPSGITKSIFAPPGIQKSTFASIVSDPSNPWNLVSNPGSKRERDEIQREQTKALNKEGTIIVKIPTTEGKTRARTLGRAKILDQLKRLMPQANDLAVDILASGDIRITCATPNSRDICFAEEKKWMNIISTDGQIAKATYPVMAHGAYIAGLNLADHARIARSIERDNAHNIPGLQRRTPPS